MKCNLLSNLLFRLPYFGKGIIRFTYYNAYLLQKFYKKKTEEFLILTYL